MDIDGLGDDVDVFDCGEDELDPSQEQFYSNKANDIAELVETVICCQAAITVRRKDLTRPNTLLDPVVQQNNKSAVPAKSTAPSPQSASVVVQTSSGGNGQGYMILDPNTLRIVSSGNNVKVYTVTPTTAVASSTKSVVTPSSHASPRPPSSTSQVTHNLPQQLTPKFRPVIRALTPCAVNTRIIQTSITRMTTSQSSPRVSVQVNNASTSQAQTPATIPIQVPPRVSVLVNNASTSQTQTPATIPIQVPPRVSVQVNNASTSQTQTPASIPIQVRVISPPQPSTARFKVISKPSQFKPIKDVPRTTSPGFVPAASSFVPLSSLTANVSTYSKLATQAPNFVYVPMGSQTQNNQAYTRVVVSQAPSTPSVAPVVSKAPNISAHKPIVTQGKIVSTVSQGTKITLYGSDLSQPKTVQLSAEVPQPEILQMSQPVSQITPLPPLITPVKNETNQNNTSNSSHDSLPLLPLTRVSPPPLPIPSSKLPPWSITKPPTEGTSEVLGGVKSTNVANGKASPSSSDLVDLTTEDNQSQVSSKITSENANVSLPQSKNAKKNLVKEKTFPSLVVSARACLKIIPNSVASSERLALDNQLRKILSMSPQKFTEYLLQQRLLRSEQQCKIHSQNLKLGMYSDSSKYTHSGGYVWISECCNAGFGSVFTGSIFDKTVHSPTTILKLMYHWSCNTSVHNVLQWVKVDNFIVKTYYTFFRAVCTATVQEKMGLLGGDSKNVQIGVISLGTTEGQGKKNVKVDILAALDTETVQLQLRALDNSEICNDSDFYQKKLKRILETLQVWVHPNSTIITDFPVDFSLCRQYGFGNVLVSGGKHSSTNNLEVVGYLKNWVPKMFQNTLNLLSIQIIQQFLDELVWRERWGPLPARAYESMINHISDITKLPGPDIITKLKKIASFPAKNWKFSVWKNSTDCTAADKSSSGGASPIQPLTVSMPSTAPVPKLENPLQEFTSKLRNTLLACKDVKPNTQSAVRKPGPLNPRKSFGGVPSEFDSKLKRPECSDDTFDIDDIIPLESYYYGYIRGIPNRQKSSGAFLAECALCKRDFLTSSGFTKHLIHHALNDNEAWSRGNPDHLMSVCHICLQPVNDVAAHLAKRHPKPMYMTQTACKICNMDQKSDERLFKHMTTVHCELDMPYSCQECQFRTSIYEDAAVHFKTYHDRDTCLQCPFCLKVIRFCTSAGLEIPSNQYYFIQHIQKHNVSKLNRKCEKCMLSFTNMTILKSHQENFHCSGKNLFSAIRYNNNPSKFVKMKRPVSKPLPPVTLHESSFHTLKGKALATIFNLDPALSKFDCAECDSPIVPNHFSVKMTCTRCTFQSHCANAIKEHSARTHLTLDVLVSKLPQIMGGTPLQSKTLFCSQCPFSSINGNRMASHLAYCESTAVATTEKRKLQYLNGNDEFPSKLPKYY